MSFKLKISPKDRASARFIANVQRAIIECALHEKKTNGVSQQMIANRLGVNRSVVNRILRGESNLTLRSIGELSWALGHVPSISFCENDKAARSNYFDNDGCISNSIIRKDITLDGSAGIWQKTNTKTATSVIYETEDA